MNTARESANGGKLAIYIDPLSHHLLGDRLFREDGSPYGGDDVLAPHRAVRDYFQARGVPVHTADALGDRPTDEGTSVYISLGSPASFRKLSSRPDTIASAFFVFECPIIDPSLYSPLHEVEKTFRRVYCWGNPEELQRFTRGRPVNMRRFWWPQSYREPHDGLWNRGDRRFMVMINANKLPRVYWRELYTKRVDAVAYFHQFGEVDLYGKHWDDVPRRVGNAWVPVSAKRLHEWVRRQWQHISPDPAYAAAAAAYRGPAESKSETLSRYVFALCFENMILEGWITEKLFDCFFTGTVPIYWGAPDIQEWVPKDCYVDFRDFGGFEELREYLHGLSPADIAAYRESARAFLASSAFDRFSTETYVNLFRQIVAEDTGWTG